MNLTEREIKLLAALISAFAIALGSEKISPELLDALVKVAVRVFLGPIEVPDFQDI